jgi:mono/diheme cytochrome c family protein
VSIPTVGWCALATALALGGDGSKPRPPTPREAEFFESKVRPVLAERCFGCHGPEKQKGGLRLDSPSALLKGGDGGPVVVPGDPENSPLVEAIRYDGPTRMPPKGKLPPQAVADLEAWVKMGAPWPDAGSPGAGDATPEARARHWAFQPVRDPEPPVVQSRDWPRTTIDRFVLARLERAGLAPSPMADRRTLIRRATFDLIGLPPTPEEVAAFEADESPDAFARVVDRLLASPHYGERWGRHWLDVARYADTKGYVFLEEPEYPWAYTYRDYVVRALNEDLPYDQFLREQIAADRLPRRDDRSLAALGFLTVGGRFMNNPHDIIDDRIDVVTRGLMGLTVACARCHDHKFDPIPTKDYYSLYGVFDGTAEPTVPPLLGPPPQTDEYAAFAKELRARERRLEEFIRSKHEELVASARRRAADYLMASHAARGQPDTEDFMLLADGADLNPRMLKRWQNYLERTRRRHDPVFGPWHALAALPEAGFAAGAAAIARTLAEAPDPARPVNPLIARALAESPPKTLAEAARLYGILLNRAEAIGQDWDRRAALNGAGPSPLPFPEYDQLRRVFHGPDAPPEVPLSQAGDLELLPDRPSQEKLKELRSAIEKWRDHGPGAPPRAMALEDAPSPSQPRVFLRGNPGNPGEAVPRRFLTVLSGPDRRPFRDGSGRLELAHAIADRANPLTARVLVNRVWMHHFGAPLVGTPGDFGLRSEPPTHPELLDHLASAFMADGWSLKALHRRVLLSAAYQQSSDDRPEGLRRDPENRLLWRMNRRRLDFEATRDALLAASGRLDRTLGGPAAKDIAAPSATRRTLYGHIDRLNLPGLFRTFDFPDPNTTSPRRDATTIAPQALFLMNNPFVLAAARASLSRPEVAAEADPARRIGRLYRLFFGREPSDEEATIGVEYLHEAGASPAAWERYAQALLVSNEFVIID